MHIVPTEHSSVVGLLFRQSTFPLICSSLHGMLKAVTIEHPSLGALVSHDQAKRCSFKLVDDLLYKALKQHGVSVSMKKSKATLYSSLNNVTSSQDYADACESQLLRTKMFVSHCRGGLIATCRRHFEVSDSRCDAQFGSSLIASLCVQSCNPRKADRPFFGYLHCRLSFYMHNIDSICSSVSYERQLFASCYHSDVIVAG